jgi:Mrp family chromosome partitioning ATPase
MSRNFDILEQTQKDRELFRVAPIAPTEPEHTQRGRANVPLASMDGLGHEELLRLAHQLFLATDDKRDSGPRQVVFCGIDTSEGTNALCADLSRVLASQVTSQVCVVDADVHAPAIHRLLEKERSYGQSFGSGATGDSRLLERVAGNLWLISACSSGGKSTSLDQVRSQMNALSPEFGYVVINARPVAAHSDAVLMGQKAEGVVLVLEANSTRRVAARKAEQALAAANVQVLGVVLNNRTFPVPERIYRLL